MRVPSIATVNVKTDALRRNLAATVKSAGVPAYCVVKADAYGHGASLVARALAAEPGCYGFVVSRLEEAVALRASDTLRASDALAEGEGKPLLCLGTFLAAHGSRVRTEVLELLAALQISPVIVCQQDVDALVEAPAARVWKVPAVHIAVDTGMRREGIEPEQLKGVLAALREKRIAVASVFSHYVESEVAASPITARQHELFNATLSHAGVDPGTAGVPQIHMANSAGALVIAKQYEVARVGGALYGVVDLPPSEVNDVLEPVMSVRSCLVQVHRVANGTAVGYNGTWRAERDSIIGLVAAGYADGLGPRLPALGWCPGSADLGTADLGAAEPRAGEDRAMVRAPVVGTVSMDLVTIDLTDAAQRASVAPRVGDEVVLLGTASRSPGTAILASEYAELMACSPYAVTVAFGSRLPVQTTT